MEYACRALLESMERHLMEDGKPSGYFNALDDACLNADFPFTMLGELKNTRQSPQYHPEGSVWNHTMLVIDEASLRKTKSSDSRVLMWAALLHDIGKPATTSVRQGKITSYNHEKVGAGMVRQFFNVFDEDAKWINRVAALVRWHMQILHVVRALPYADIEGMKEQTSVEDVALLGLCDRLGRLGADRRKEEEDVRIFLQKCGKIP